MKKIIIYIIKKARIMFYKLLSTCKRVEGKPILKQPILTLGRGKIVFKGKVTIGYFPSPYFFSTNAHIEARKENTEIIFGDNIIINNNFSCTAEGEGISIGDNCLIGTNVSIFDSDFHDLNPKTRFGGVAKKAPVKIGNNVFIGSNVTILKGVTIGDNSVVGSGSIVAKSIPANVVVAGIPAKVIRELKN